jgi:hypothetical protein
MGRWKAMLVVSLPLAGLLGAALLLDLFAAASSSRQFVGAVAALGVLVAGGIAIGSRRMESLLPLVPFAAVLTLLSMADTSPLKPFGRFYAAIEPGMTEVEVFQALDAQFPPTGWYPRPAVNRQVGPTSVGFILDPKDGRYDAEIVALDFQNGRVTAKRYYPD